MGEIWKMDDWCDVEGYCCQGPVCISKYGNTNISRQKIAINRRKNGENWEWWPELFSGSRVNVKKEIQVLVMKQFSKAIGTVHITYVQRMIT